VVKNSCVYQCFVNDIIRKSIGVVWEGSVLEMKKTIYAYIIGLLVYLVMLAVYESFFYNENYSPLIEYLAFLLSLLIVDFLKKKLR
jgi:hypothetical protein